MTYPRWPKTPRLYDDIVVTEKIDGTCSLIAIEKITVPEAVPLSGQTFVLSSEGDTLSVRAGSRERWLVPGKNTDNFGFAQWVADNAEALSLLGEGLHYGEWYGKGIQRGYGLEERRFALFNPYAFGKLANIGVAISELTALVSTVPVLYTGVLEPQGGTDHIHEALFWMKRRGSYAVPGFMQPEGIVIHHVRAKTNFKVVIDGNGEKRVG